ncbi:hypothetical protein [Bradyrhizobium sp.]|uniref:hypothetical protein n=1 Tax=Bradyrhizobium sp. TaxID=376 RepID=UPI0040382E10
MSVLKEIAAAVAGVCALIFACDAVFGVGEARFDDDYYLASFYAPRPSHEFRFARDATPAARISDTFAQFTPGEAKPGRRYSSLTTIVR